MPRKSKPKPESYYSAFPSAIRKLMENKGKTQQDIADAIGKTRQAVGYYVDGSSSPDWETIATIATFFEVSSDYLLGLSGDERRSPSSVDELGLSNEAVEALQALKSNDYDKAIEAINYFIEQELPSPRALFPEHFYGSQDAPKNLKESQDKWDGKKYIPVLSVAWDYIRTKTCGSIFFIDAEGNIQPVGAARSDGFRRIEGNISLDGLRQIEGGKMIEQVFLDDIMTMLKDARKKYQATKEGAPHAQY